MTESKGDAEVSAVSTRIDAAEKLSGKQEILDLLEKSQASAVDGSRGSFANALRALHSALVSLRSPSSLVEGDEGSTSKQANGTTPAREILQSQGLESDAPHPVPRSEMSQREFLQTVAEKMINLERVVVSIDEEIDGGGVDVLDYKGVFDWYRDAIEMVDMEAEVASGTSVNLLSSSEDAYAECTDPERWIDICLDACGYAISLEAAVDCLRRIARDPSAPLAITIPSNSSPDLKGPVRRPGLATAVTSLRTIRRRLILSHPSNLNQTDALLSVPEPHQSQMTSLARALGHKMMCHLSDCLILPLEYGTQPNNENLSESLSSLAMSVVPALVSSACHAIDLPLPSWAAPKASSGMLMHSAWKMLLAGDLLSRGVESLSGDAPSPVVNAAASDHFQFLVRKMIEKGRSDVVAGHLFRCWASASDGAEARHLASSPRTLLCRQLQLALASIPSKRRAAVFCQEMLRHCAKGCLGKSEVTAFSGRPARDELDRLFSANDCFLHILLPFLANDSELAEAMVNYSVLTPPTSFHRQLQSSSTSCPTLSAVDWAIPRSLAQLLARACTDDKLQCSSAAAQEQNDSDDSAEAFQTNAKRDAFLSHLFTVASVWCEDIFVSRTDPLQQQYVTEFLLQPLESRQLTRHDLQAGIFDDGAQLATTLVQGVTLRLDVSRTESIRLDGMRVAEAMATLLGQNLHFEELQPLRDGDTGVEQGMAVKEKENAPKSKKRSGKKRRGRLGPKIPVVVDPDAECFTDDSDSSEETSQSDSSADEGDESSDTDSSWGEDSLEPYEMNDDEEDLRRVPRPRTLRECLAYFISAENDDLAYDKHEAALTELAKIVASEPLDLVDVGSGLVRMLLFLEDKFSIPQFLEKRWDGLMAFGVHAPMETCVVLVQEMRGNISLGTRLDALAVLGGVAQELSGVTGQKERAIFESSDQEVVSCSTKLRRVLDLQRSSERNSPQNELSKQSTKTRRWRRSRTPHATSTNRFGPVAVQVIYPLFSLLSDTRGDETIWGGAIGEKFLSEYLKTLSMMLHSARNHPSSALPVIAGDLFNLAWSFHDAKCAEVRYAALVAFATCVSIEPSLVLRVSGLRSYLRRCIEHDESADCRSLALLVEGNITEALN